MVSIKLFALARDQAGVAELSLDVPPGATVGDAAGRLTEHFPSTAAMLPRVAFADSIAGDHAWLMRSTLPACRHA